MKNARTIRLGVLLIFFGLLFPIDYSSASEIYFPLDEGKTWKYQLFINENVAEIFVTNLSLRKLNGKKVTPKKWEWKIRSESGGAPLFQFFAEDKRGIYVFATQSAEDIEPEISSSPGFILKYPIQIGTTWEEKSRTVFFDQKFVVKLRNIIDKLDEVVTVPAGTFKKCIRVKGVGTTVKGSTIINVEQYSWFAPRVGFIKTIRKEKSNNINIGKGGTTVTQLESYVK